MFQQRSNALEETNALLTNKFFTSSDNELLELLSHITRISKESRSLAKNLHNSVSKITSMIHLNKDISEQTNLLALNTAIEAARAGEDTKEASKKLFGLLNQMLKEKK